MDKEVIFWDFDGVLMNSNEVRDSGFERVLADYPETEVALLMDFHRKNGGWSRYVKFRYFFETIRGEQITEEGVNHWAKRFSKLMLDSLLNPDLLIAETNGFVARHAQNVKMHIVSGSDQTELRQICAAVGIADHFRSIHGSPTPKQELVRTLIAAQGYDPKDCVLVGDSGNDYEAAKANGVDFMAYNNPDLERYTNYVIDLNA